MHHLLFPLILTTLLTAMGCTRKVEDMAGPTIGSLTILADESCRYIVSQEEDIFERTYKYAHLDIRYVHEIPLFQKFFADSVDVVMTTRGLTREEKMYFNQRQSFPREFAYATSAIAFVANKTAPDSNFRYEELLRLFKEEKSGTLFVLENAKSGIANVVMNLLGTESLPAHFYALQSKEEVLTYVEKYPRAIGIIDYTDISDSDSALSKKMLMRIQLVGVSRPADSTQMGFVRPYQYNLQDRKYPFTRDLYLISKTGKTDVSIGFAAFICGEIGQKIVLKSGLLPKFQSERIIEITPTDDIKVVK